MISKTVKYNKKLQTYSVGQPCGLQFTQHFFSQPVYFINSRRNEPLYQNDCNLVKNEMKTPQQKNLLLSD